jgi:proprotein convertase subtilisin/kexin type 5
MLKVVQHELTHVLGFSANLYQYFADPLNPGYMVGTANLSHIFTNGSEPSLNTTLVVQTAQLYYNDSTITQMRLEDYGKETYVKSSHWERTVLKNEYMTATSFGKDAVITNFTLALLQDTGWY